ncbi:MAG: elongation factor P [Chloroflexi bacterium]|nr:MAG: elongation factor P [Chloroflexota bacterium]
MISTNDFRNGTMFEMDGQLLSIVSVEHIKLARAGAVIKAKLRNVLTGSIFEQSFRSGDKYRTVRIDSTEATYSYSDGTHHYFMDTKTYDQVPVDEDMLESVLPLLKEGKGDTVSGATKPARLETGTTIHVPLFIQSGDMIRVDTRDHSYVERA